MNNNQIVYIDVNKIHPHPHNPRKNLGDLTELAESIRVSGILQNLTVVPKPGGPADHYYAVIGHRRHSAAKKAGLLQVPCVISNMDDREQIRTMMVENMNRSDLTVYEQAEGFQMMLDFGDSLGEIAEKTGFSEATVRRRVKLLELDSDKFQKSVKRGATLQDFVELEKIKDPDVKNGLLDSIGTANFNYALKKARDSEKDAEKIAVIIADLESFATKIDSTAAQSLKHIKSYSSYGKLDLERPADAGQRDYFYTVSTYGAWLYAEPTAQEKLENTAHEQMRQKNSERGKQLEKIAKRSFELRCDFVKGLTGLKKQLPLLTEFTVQSLLPMGYYASRFDKNMFLRLLGIKLNKGEELSPSILAEPLKANTESVLLAAAYANMGDGSSQQYHGYDGKHRSNAVLDLVYDYLERLGYELSDEERAYRDGTHELFKTDELGNVA